MNTEGAERPSCTDAHIEDTPTHIWVHLEPSQHMTEGVIAHCHGALMAVNDV